MNHTPSPSNSGPPARLPGPNPIIKRKKPPADPFFSSRKALPRRPNPAVNGQPTSLLNGNVAKLARPITPASRRSESPAQPDIPLSDRVSGFSDAKVTAQSIPYTDYKVVTTKRELLNGLRYHVMQLTDEKDLDIRNEADFSKPATLHRRDPRAQATNIVREEVEEDKLGLTQQEREELNKKKEARQKERAENLAQVAPSMGPTRKHNNFKKKTQQVFRPEYTAEDKRRIQTNYEEKLPWNLVDFDKKHCLVGLHQPTAAQTNVAFIFESAGHGGLDRYRLLPVEKVYHFSQKREDKIPKMTIEEVEKAMKRRGGDPEWLIRQREARVAETVREMDARRAKGIVSAAQLDTRAGRQGEEADLDFDDDFADDEEGDLFVDKDEDTKLAESKIKEDQLLANIFDMKEEKEYDEAEVREKKESEARRKNFKGLRKALERRERNYNHGSDSEQSWGTSTDSEEEKAEKERQASAIKGDVDDKKGNISSSGANTPSSRKEKVGSDREGLPRSSSSKSLKRPGSPNLSDASGTDASTRKKKKHRHSSSTQPTPQPSRPISPANVPSSSAPILNGPLDPSTSKSFKKRNKSTVGAGSDTEAAAHSDAAMSDGTRAQRLKLKVRGGAAPTPSDGSRSPPRSQTPQPTAAAGSPGSRPTSPPPASSTRFPTVEEIRAAIPPTGITIKDFLAKVAHPKERRAELIKLVRAASTFVKERGLLVPKGTGPETVNMASPGAMSVGSPSEG